MKVTMYGTRGSIPTPTDNNHVTSEFGGNTTCVLVETVDGGYHIFDAGSGIRKLGLDLVRRGFNGKGASANLYISHTHWDHIQGFPFFGPAYIPGNNITLYGEAQVAVHAPHGFGNLKIGAELADAVSRHSDAPASGIVLEVNGDGVKRVLANQQNPRNFPAPLDALVSMSYRDFIPESGAIYANGSVTVETKRVNHPGGCISYRLTEQKPDGTKAIAVINTDFEPLPQHEQGMVEWWQGADLVLADSQYEPEGTKDTPNPFMKGWGHSDYQTDIRWASAAGVKRLLLTHHEPKMDDNYHRTLEQKAHMFASAAGARTEEIHFAREGKTYEL